MQVQNVLLYVLETIIIMNEKNTLNFIKLKVFKVYHCVQSR